VDRRLSSEVRYRFARSRVNFPSRLIRGGSSITHWSWRGKSTRSLGNHHLYVRLTTTSQWWGYCTRRGFCKQCSIGRQALTSLTPERASTFLHLVRRSQAFPDGSPIYDVEGNEYTADNELRVWVVWTDSLTPFENLRPEDSRSLQAQMRYSHHERRIRES
jgi:hypothetical protein